MTKCRLLIVISIIMLPIITGILLLRITSYDRSSAIFFTPGSRKIGLVQISDVIYSSGEYVKQLINFRKDKSIAGVILRINSPGGGVAPSQEIYEEVMQYKRDKKPIVVSMGSVAASGGYYIASPAEKIFANRGTITGSIGVIFQFPNYYKLLDKIGIKITTIKAGKYKDVGNPNRDLTEEEKKYLQQLIDNTHDQFINDICNARNMDEEKVRQIADGRIFTGEQALEEGLIDSLGGYNAALSYLKKSLGLPEKAKVVEKKYSGFIEKFFPDGMIKQILFFKKSNISAGAYYLLDNY